MRFEAVNNVIILKKDTDNEFDRLSMKDMKQIFIDAYNGVV